jgi:predicted Zn-dependent protease with MMP-like domain
LDGWGTGEMKQDKIKLGYEMNELEECLKEKELNKKLKRDKYILFAGFILILFLFFTLFFMAMSAMETKSYRTIFNYSDLTLEQQNEVKIIIDEIKPEYLIAQKSITFTNNLTKYYSENIFERFYNKITNATNPEELGGFNRAGNNYIRYYKNEYYLKIVLCHEMLHTFFLGDERAHRIIYSLEDYMPCFIKRGDYDSR